MSCGHGDGTEHVHVERCYQAGLADGTPAKITNADLNKALREFAATPEGKAWIASLDLPPRLPAVYGAPQTPLPSRTRPATHSHPAATPGPKPPAGQGHTRDEHDLLQEPPC